MEFVGSYSIAIVVIMLTTLLLRKLLQLSGRVLKNEVQVVQQKEEECKVYESDLDNHSNEEPNLMAPSAVYLNESLNAYEGLQTSEAWSETEEPRTDLLRRGSPLYGVSRYPPSFLRFSKRLRERNMCAAAFAAGFEVKYWEAPTRDGGVSCRRFFCQNYQRHEKITLDAAHPQLQDATDGSNMIDGVRLKVAAGPRIRYLEAATLDRTVSPEQLAAALRSCTNLISCCLTECRIDSAVLSALPRSTLRSLRLSMCTGMTDASLAAALRGATALRYLDIEASGEQQPTLPGPASAQLLRFSKLIVLRLSDRGCGSAGFVDHRCLGHLALRPTLDNQHNSGITTSLTTLHIEHRFRERTPPAPLSLVQAIARCNRLSDVDGFRLPSTIPSANVAARINRLLVSPSDLRRLADTSSSVHRSWMHLRELLIVATKDSKNSLGALDARLIALFKALGVHLTSFVVRVHCQAGQLSDIFPQLPNLRHCSLANALGPGEFFEPKAKSTKNSKASDLHDLHGHHDADLRFLSRHCPQLRVLDLSNTNGAYATFSEIALENLVDRLQHLTDIYLYECGSKFNYRSIPTKGGRVAVHYASFSPASPTTSATSHNSNSTTSTNGGSADAHSAALSQPVRSNSNKR
uniref:F-box domain-containing protein n=1 Tax=Aureoumbra lagunensis TaxID=44058 RepID=A0A7S3NJ27_9STRA